jgi:unsaturated rhamnogalacturonyl hydrolase
MGLDVDAQSREKVGLAADLLLEHDTKCWFFGDSVGFEALMAASDLFGDPKYAAYAHGFFRAWRTRAEPYRESDNTAPGHAMCLSYERTGDALVLDGAVRLATYLRSRPRLGDVFTTFADTPLTPPAGPGKMSARDAALLSNGGAGVFVDCLHFDPPFFTHLGSLVEDESLVNLGVEQALGYGRLLQDDDTDLFNHFYLERTGTAHILGWTRGQAWALCGMLDVLAYCSEGHPGRAELIERSKRLASALLSYQREDGHWYAVAQKSASGEEASGAAFGAYQFWRGIDLGVLDEATFGEPAARAWSAAMDCVTDEGKLTLVSAAVGSSTLPSHYHHVSLGHTVPWGQGPLVLAAAHAP